MAIYKGESLGTEVGADVAHVQGSSALAMAVAAGDTAGVLKATHQLVYHRHWHIVRLRVISSAGQVLADVGGPYILAPVPGKITYNGRRVGSYVMSVQDDVGYAKLVTRLTGLPIELYSNGVPLVGQAIPLAEIPHHLPVSGSQLTIDGTAFIASLYSVEAFPSGRAEVLLGVPRASATLAAGSCEVVSATIYTSIAKDLAARLKLPGAAQTFVGIDHEFDPSKLVFVREGSSTIAASPGAPAPPTLPASGTINYQGTTWLVQSFTPVAGTRIFLLYPEVVVSGQSGPTGTS